MTDKQLQAHRKRAYQEREEIEREAQTILELEGTAFSGTAKYFENGGCIVSARFAELARRAHTLDFVLETLNRMSRT